MFSQGSNFWSMKAIFYPNSANILLFSRDAWQVHPLAWYHHCSTTGLCQKMASFRQNWPPSWVCAQSLLYSKTVSDLKNKLWMWLIDRVFVYHKVLGLILSTRRTLYSVQSLQVGGRGRKIRCSWSFSMHSNFQASQNSITQCLHSLYQLQSILLCLKDFWLVIANFFKPLSSLLSLILTPQTFLEPPHALPPLGIPL